MGVTKSGHSTFDDGLEVASVVEFTGISFSLSQLPVNAHSHTHTHIST